jgi:hypothetical protein
VRPREAASLQSINGCSRLEHKHGREKLRRSAAIQSVDNVSSKLNGANMSRNDGSMYGWTPESIDEKARRDAEDGERRQIPGWIGSVSPYSEAGSRYNRAFDHHRRNRED